MPWWLSFSFSYGSSSTFSLETLKVTQISGGSRYDFRRGEIRSSGSFHLPPALVDPFGKPPLFFGILSKAMVWGESRGCQTFSLLIIQLSVSFELAKITPPPNPRLRVRHSISLYLVCTVFLTDTFDVPSSDSLPVFISRILLPLLFRQSWRNNPSPTLFFFRILAIRDV